MYEKKIPVTVQGSRTGLAAAAVPYEGHIMNLSRMDKVLPCRQDEQTGTFYFTLQPGVLLSELRKMISGKRFQTADWTEEAKAPIRPSAGRRSSSLPRTPPRLRPPWAAW